MSTKTTEENDLDTYDVDTNICLYIIFPGGFAADFEYTFAEISLTTPRNSFYCKGLKQRKDTPGIDLLKINNQLDIHIGVTSLKLESLYRHPKQRFSVFTNNFEKVSMSYIHFLKRFEP